MKQTAVEWLIEQINPYGLSVHQDLFNQAKEMEKQQKEYFFNCGRQYQLTGDEHLKKFTTKLLKTNKLWK